MLQKVLDLLVNDYSFFGRLILTQMLLDGVIDEETMSKLNAQVETEGKKPKEAATDFLEDIGLLEKKK